MDAEERVPVDRVLEWRREVLECAGFDAACALVLAANRGVDLHDAVSLLRSGCPPSTAVLILE